MKYHKIVLFVLALIIAQCYNIAFAEEFSGGENVKKGDKLEVSITNGNISVNVWQRDEVSVNAKNIDVEDVSDFSFKKNGNVVSLKFKGQDSNNFYLEVSMPEYLMIELATGGGNISIKNKVSGTVQISTGGGNINLSDVANTLSIATGGGNVTVGVISEKAEISTGGGEVKVASALKKLEISTGGGNITVSSIGGNAEISTGGGNVSIGSVSGSAELSTAGGNINLEGATGKVEVNTAGGNISLKNISGSIEANTAGGNIYAEFNPTYKSNSELNTASGDITLNIPSDAKANIVASVYASSKLSESEKDNLIKSDFEEATVDVQKNNLIKKYVLNGGGALIELNSAYGRIKINKK